MAPRRAYAAPVEKLSAPGPSVLKQTPGWPVKRPYVEAMKAAGYKVAPWVEEMLAEGNTSFYKIQDSTRLYYSPQSRAYTSPKGGGREGGCYGTD